MDCLRISEELNEKKFVIDFFKALWSPNLKWSKPATFGPNPSVIFFDPLAKIAAIVLP